MTEDLTSLLDRLKAADPDTWQECNLAYNALCEQWAEGAIQEIVQAACEKRGWDWSIEKFHDTIFAEVVIPHECWTDEIFRANGKLPAMALLSAYLAANEKEKL